MCKMNIKKIIREEAGISSDARMWSDIVYNELMSHSEERERIIIDCYNKYPEAYQNFKVDYIVIDYYDTLTGYDDEKSGYDKDGYYVVLLYIQPQLVAGQHKYGLKSALNHEFKHAFQDYMRKTKNKPSLKDTKESKELYTRDFVRLLSDINTKGPIKNILTAYYYVSDLEISAYLENVYDSNPQYEKIVNSIATMSPTDWGDLSVLEDDWDNVNRKYNIPFLKKFKSVYGFIKYTIKYLPYKAKKVLKKINKMKYVHKKL